MIIICSKCGSINIGYDAWVDKDGNLVGGPYDHTMCMDCESFDSAIEKEE